MTLREQVGQLLMLGMDGCELGVVQAAWLRMLQPGGIVLFQRNIESATQARALLEAVQATTRAAMLRAVDLEGGQVDRLREALAPMPSAGKVAAMSSDRQRIVLWNAWDGRKVAAEVYLTGQTHHRVADLAFASVS